MNEMDFLKTFRDMEPYFDPFTDEELGRLYRAMMRYAFHGEEPNFEGNERFIWAVLKKHIVVCAEKSQRNSENGKKGGRPSKPKESEEKPEKANETEKKAKKEKEKEKEKDQEKDHEQEKEKEKVGGVTFPQTPTAAAENVIGIDGLPLDLSRAQFLDKAETLIKKYHLPLTENILNGVADDIQNKGFDLVSDAFVRASEADSRGGVSFNFYRAVLDGMGQNKTFQTTKSGSIQTHDMTERQEYINRAKVNLDDIVL